MAYVVCGVWRVRCDRQIACAFAQPRPARKLGRGNGMADLSSAGVDVDVDGVYTIAMRGGPGVRSNGSRCQECGERSCMCMDGIALEWL